MPAFAIFAEIKLKPGCRDRYLPEIRLDAASSLANEPGCRLFHIHQAIGGGGTFCLYEVYDSEAAFKAHQASPHFLHYLEATKDLVEARTIRKMTVVD